MAPYKSRDAGEHERQFYTCKNCGRRSQWGQGWTQNYIPWKLFPHYIFNLTWTCSEECKNELLREGVDG